MSEYLVQNTAGCHRRTFLRTSSLALVAVWASRSFGVISVSPAMPGYPFTLGVASGDPSEDGFVIWTRLAPIPFQPDGGMPPDPVKVSWRVAEDEAMSRIVAQGETTATPAWAHSVHVETQGLRPGRWYWYDFSVGRETSPQGRTRTMPAASQRPEKLRFGFVSCQHYETGFYTAYNHMSRENLDLAVHLGDYIYTSWKAEKVRSHRNRTVKTLDEYRSQYALYRTDPLLQRIHAQVPFILTWDDHEVKNDYAGAADHSPKKLAQRAAACKAYYEHMPLRRASLPQGPDMQIYRELAFGQLAKFHVLDTRQYRTRQPAGPEAITRALDPAGTIMGGGQRQWLLDSLTSSATVWNIIAQQVPMARIDSKIGPGEAYGMDKWTGYENDRRTVLRHLRDHQIANAVVITGDVHKNIAAELAADFDQPETAPVATEFIGTSISSDGDGQQRPKSYDALMVENPFIKFMNHERGYVVCELTANQWRTDYRTVEYVSRPDAPVHTRASFIVEPDRPFLQRA